MKMHAGKVTDNDRSIGSTMRERKAVVQNGQGIHCRPSALIVKYAGEYEGNIKVTGERGTTALRSIMELMTLELYPDSEVTIQVEGPDEDRGR